ncbi:MAG TPA: CBS domain-containing protein [Polyangiaceae bacterium]|nr:CBS domain-containing protein [Polyangiaceae bacterium]
MPAHRIAGDAAAPVDQFMTAKPHCIGRDQPLSRAHEQMRALRVRHLPVLDGGKLVGVLSQRDLFFTETLRDVDPATVPVEDAMSADVYVVPPETPIREVAARMVEHKYGCAVVARGGHVTGIFTTTDALRVLAGLTGSRASSSR